MSAFLIVATVAPPRSISILSRIVSFFSWILYSSAPEEASSRTSVSRIRSAFPSTLKARSPSPSSIQKSSPTANSFSRIRYFVPSSPPRRRNSPIEASSLSGKEY